MASLAISLLADPNAYAGTFVWQTTDSNGNITAKSPVYSGGSVGGGPSGPNSSVSTGPFTSNGYYVGNAGYAGYSNGGCNADAKGNATSVTMTASGPLTATFTWQPAYPGEPAPAPASVILYQDCRAALTNNRGCNGNASSVCTDGLGGSATLPFTGMQAATESYKYSVGTAGSVSASCSPNAVYGISCGSGVGSYASGAASISYTATAYPVTISLGGATKDSSGNYNILIGQECTASLTGIPSGCTVSNWNWSVTGTTFQSWSASNSYTIEVDGPGPTAYSTASWFWDDLKTASDTVTCTVTVTPPSGQGAPFSLTVTQPVNVVVPAWSCQGTGGTMQVNTSDGSGNGTDYWLYAGPANGSSTGRGMDWVASVTPPGAPFSGSGSLEMVQTETPNSTYTSTAGVVYTRSNNGQQGLDTSYAYPWQSPLPNPPSYESGDSPGLDLIGMASAQLKYSFVDTLMYEPPGGSQYVPIATFTWSTNGNAQIPATKNWADYGSGSAGAVTPSGTTNFTASIAFPSWAQNVGNGTWSWVAPK